MCPPPMPAGADDPDADDLVGPERSARRPLGDRPAVVEVFFGPDDARGDAGGGGCRRGGAEKVTSAAGSSHAHTSLAGAGRPADISRETRSSSRLVARMPSCSLSDFPSYSMPTHE